MGILRGAGSGGTAMKSVPVRRSFECGGRSARLVYVLLAVVLSSAGPSCEGGGETGPPAGLEEGCHRAVITSGFGLRWATLNHRISLWSVYPRLEGPCLGASPGDRVLSVGCVGGPWSTGHIGTDTPWVSYEYWTLESPLAAFSTVSVPITIDAPSAFGTGSVRIDLARSGLRGYQRYAALLLGLRLETGVKQNDPLYPPEYDPSWGYTSRGIGAGIVDLDTGDGTLDLAVWARFEHGPSDRADMNRALQHARTRAVVHVLLVGLSSGAYTAETVSYRLEYPKPRRFFAPDYPHAPEELRRIEIQGAAGLPVAVAGLSGFDLCLFGSSNRGDYVRELSASVRLVSYDPGTGRVLLDVDGFASNVGLLTYETMENDVSATVVVLQVPEGRATAGRLNRAFETGEALIELNGRDQP